MRREEFNLICKKIEKFEDMMEDDGYSSDQKIIIKDRLKQYKGKRDYYIKYGAVE